MDHVAASTFTRRGSGQKTRMMEQEWHAVSRGPVSPAVLEAESGSMAREDTGLLQGVVQSTTPHTSPRIHRSHT